MPNRACHCLVALLLLAACAGSVEDPTRLLTTRDSTGGVLRIRHAGPAPVWTPELTLSIGTEEDGPAGFGRIRALLLARDGGVLVADAGNTVVREFGPDGAWRRDIGRDGAGPGEYRQPYSLGWLGDSLLLLDPQNARIGIFHRDGSWAGQRPSAMLMGGRHARLYPSGDGILYQIALATGEGSPVANRIFVGHSAAGPVDTLLDLPPRQDQAGSIVCNWPNNQGLTFFEVPFSPRRLQLPGPAGTYLLADSERFRIVSITPAGDTTRIVERDATPVPITDAEWEEGTREFRETREKNPQLACPVSTLPRPGAKPALDDMFLADDGTLWVDRWSETGLVTEVFGPSGDLLGAFPAPPRERMVDPSARGRRMAVVALDVAGYLKVQVYELR